MNKVKKRILCLLLCVVLLASLLPAAFADNTVTTDETAEVGKYVKFSYTAGDALNSNAGAITVNFNYNANKLKLLSVKANPINGVSAVSFSQTDIDTANTMGTAAKFGACWVDEKLSMNPAPTDVLLEANFEILVADAPEIKVVEATFHSVNEDNLTEVENVLNDAVNVSAEATTTVVEIVEEIIIRKAGDVNGDGEVDNKDLVRLRKYLARVIGTEINASNADVNSDNDVTNKDLVRLRKFLARVAGTVLE